MSTKIYDGKKLPNMSVLELHQFCKKLKSKLLPIANVEYYKLVAKISQSAYVYLATGQNICDYTVDMPKLGNSLDQTSKYELLSFAREQASKLVANTSAAIRRIDSEPDADFDVSICVFPLSDKILCIPYANHDALHDELFKTEEFEEYGYWNNTDKPLNLTDDEWHQRKCDWDDALPGIGVPRDCGMLFKIIDAPYDIVGKTLLTIDDMVPYFVSNQALCEKLAKNYIFEREFQKSVEERGGDWRMHGYSCLREAQKYVESHRDEIDEMVKHYINTVRCHEFFNSEDEY